MVDRSTKRDEAWARMKSERSETEERVMWRKSISVTKAICYGLWEVNVEADRLYRSGLKFLRFFLI